jgi:hypothetical protein
MLCLTFLGPMATGVTSLRLSLGALYCEERDIFAYVVSDLTAQQIPHFSEVKPDDLALSA